MVVKGVVTRCHMGEPTVGVLLDKTCEELNVSTVAVEGTVVVVVVVVVLVRVVVDGC
jgi:hypothetical protein